MNVVSADIERQLRDNPQMQENIGEISSLKADFVKSSAEDDMDTFVYDVKGSKGEGELTVKSVTNSDGNEDIVSAQLRMSDGRTIELVLDQGDFARPWKPVE